MSSRPALLIAVHVYPDGGGISAIVENYVTSLRERYSVHVVIVEARPGWERLRERGAHLHRIGYSNLINPMVFPTSILHSAWVGARLRRLVVRVSPKVLVTQDALHLAVPAVFATRRTGTRLVLMDHGTLTNVHEPGWLPMLRGRLGGVRGSLFASAFKLDRPWRALRWRIGVKCADEVWFTGAELEPWFARAGSRAKSYSQSVPEDFTPASAEQRFAARRDLGLRQEGILVNSVGRLDGEKGLDTVLDALDSPEVLALDFTLVVAGDGSLASWLVQEIERRGLGQRVVILGRLQRAQVVTLQQASDLHLYAGTFSCGVSICLLEAMAAGVAPVASDRPTAQRQLIGDAGWVFTAGDHKELRNALTEALSTPPGELEVLGRQALQAVHSQVEPTVPERIDALVGTTSAHDVPDTIDQ